MKILAVIDMQNDFVTGVLGTKEAQAIVNTVVAKVEQYRNDKSNEVIFTKDTHYKDYLKTFEGQRLPVKHCLLGTNGHTLIPKLRPKSGELIVRKETFGYTSWEWLLENDYDIEVDKIESIELCGVCTDICVISNALILRALYPSIPIIVDAKACAGVTPEKHRAALEVMKSCQIDVINE